MSNQHPRVVFDIRHNERVKAATDIKYGDETIRAGRIGTVRAMTQGHSSHAGPVDDGKAYYLIKWDGCTSLTNCLRTEIARA